jgi:5-formyltetrahydrofolate cyclo-ligase
MDSKQALRQWIAAEKKRRTSAELSSLSNAVLAKLANHLLFQDARTVLLFHALPDEIDTRSFIEQWCAAKNILLPVVRGDNLELKSYAKGQLTVGAFGISEPQGVPFTDFDAIDLAIVPGIAFDSEGHRLGRGRGYYDRLLPLIKAPKIGLCFPFQLVERVPTASFDVKVDEVIC